MGQISSALTHSNLTVSISLGFQFFYVRESVAFIKFHMVVNLAQQLDTNVSVDKNVVCSYNEAFDI